MVMVGVVEVLRETLVVDLVVEILEAEDRLLIGNFN